jgi:hypothetical protein
VLGAGALCCAVWAAGCSDKADDPDFTKSPGYQGPLGEPGTSGVQPSRPNRPRIALTKTRIDLDASNLRDTLKVRSTGARTLTITEVDLVPGEDWRVLVGSADPRLNAAVLTDPDGDGRDGMAADTEFTLTIEYLGERDTEARATLVVRSNDTETPEVVVALGFTTAPIEVDLGVEDMGPEPDAAPMPDAAPPECTQNSDCALMMNLLACNPCPVAGPASAVSANDCRPAYDEATTFFAYEPGNCLGNCFGQPLAFCNEPPIGARCLDGVCALNP